MLCSSPEQIGGTGNGRIMIEHKNGCPRLGEKVVDLLPGKAILLKSGHLQLVKRIEITPGGKANFI